MDWLKSLVRHTSLPPSHFEAFSTEAVQDRDEYVVGSGPYETRIVVVSDTHEEHATILIPEGDVLIHCGDSTNWWSSGADVQWW